MLLSGKIVVFLAHILAVLANNYRERKSNAELNALLDRCIQEGDEDAFIEIYTYCETPLLSHIYGKIGNTQEAEDILHECLIVLLEGKYDKSKGGLITYLISISNNLTNDYKRKENNRKKFENSLKILSNLLSDETPITRIEEKELQRVVDAAIETLSPVLKETYHLYQLTDIGYSLSEIPEMLGISNAAFRTRLTDIRQHFKNKLERYVKLGKI